MTSQPPGPDPDEPPVADTDPTPAPSWEDLVVEQLSNLQEDVAKLRKDVATLKAVPLGVWPGPTQNVRDWVTNWLVPTFDMEHEVRHWDEIPALVSELTALWKGYQAMTDPKASGFDPLAWHSHLASARVRMGEHSKQNRLRNDQLDAAATRKRTGDRLDPPNP